MLHINTEMAGEVFAIVIFYKEKIYLLSI